MALKIKEVYRTLPIGNALNVIQIVVKVLLSLLLVED